MSSLILPRRPNLPYAPVLNDRYFHDSALCFLPTTLAPVNIAEANVGLTLTPVSAAVVSAGFGVGIGCTDTTRATLDTLSAGPIATSTGNGTGDYSLVAVMTPTDSGTASTPAHIRETAAPNASIVIAVNGYFTEGSGTLTSSSGTLWVGEYTGASGGRGCRVDNVVNGSTLKLAYSRIGNDKYLWVNGVYGTTNNYTSPDIKKGSTYISLGGYATATGRAASYPLHLFYAANRAFSDVELQALSASPQGLFRPERRVVFFDAATGSGAVSAALTGISSTASAGTISVTSAPAITGLSKTSAQGAVLFNLSSALTGKSVTGTPGAMAPAAQVATTGLENVLAQGSPIPTFLYAATGFALTSAQGSASTATSVPATGSETTIAKGTLTGATSITTTGQAVTFAQGSVSADIAAALSGIAASPAYGVLSVQLDGSITVSLTGISVSTYLGSLSPASSVATTGLESTSAAGTLAPDIGGIISGLAAVIASGTVTPSADGQIVLTGLSMSAVQGLFGVDSAIPAVGESVTVAPGTVEYTQFASLLGLSSTTEQGSVVPGANPTLTGAQIASEQGTVTFTLRDITVSLTGQAIIGSIGSLITSSMLLSTGTDTVIVCENGTRVYLIELKV